MSKLPAILYALRWLIRDTFAQALASGIFWLMLLITVVCTVLCASLQVVGDVPLRGAPKENPDFLGQATRSNAALAAADVVPAGAAQATGGFRFPLLLFSEDYRDVVRAQETGLPLQRGEITLAFGAVRVPLNRDRQQAVRFLEAILAGWVADGAGLLLALLWTAGFLPSFLEPHAASVLLAKPMPRWALLGGKYLGVLVFVGSQVTLLVACTWLALGLRTGIWDLTYFLCIPLMLCHFAVFFSISVLLAVTTRSTVACVFGSVVFWLLCWGMNYGRHAVLTLPGMEQMKGSFHGIANAVYWVLPKPLDFSLILSGAIQAEEHFGSVLDMRVLTAQGLFDPELSLLSSLAFAVVVLAVAGYQFVTTDY